MFASTLQQRAATSARSQDTPSLVFAVIGENGAIVPDPNSNHEDRFVAMVNARAEVNLRLSDFAPRTELKVAAHTISLPRFPVIDYHNYLGSIDPEDALRVMDSCGVEKLINITMQVGQTALDIFHRFHRGRARSLFLLWLDGLVWH